MTKYLLMTFCLLAGFSRAEQPNCEHTNNGFRCCRAGQAHDGDTFSVAIPNVHPFFTDMQVRIKGVDAGEMDSKDACELKAAVRARDILRTLLAASCDVTLSGVVWDKYGGRIVSDVLIGKVNAAEFLLSNGYAVPYDGGTKQKVDWCNPLPAWPPPKPTPSPTPKPTVTPQ